MQAHLNRQDDGDDDNGGRLLEVVSVKQQKQKEEEVVVKCFDFHLRKTETEGNIDWPRGMKSK